MENSGTRQLVVAHISKDAAGHGLDKAAELLLRQHGFFLDTCLRQLVVMHAANPQLRQQFPQMEWRSGNAAFSFLLQTATGLNSSIPGESNVLGQFKQAWQRWRSVSSAAQVQLLAPHMHRLFTASRLIRAEYLQGIGGHSYGSLTRKLLQPDAAARIVLVGAGKLSHSMTSLFKAHEVGLWHYQPVLQNVTANVRIFAAAADAARWATHIVVTIPAHTSNDQLWSGLAAGQIRTIVHLGRRRAEPGCWAHWQSTGNYFDLDDVFDLRKAQSAARSLQIYRASLACERLAFSEPAANNSPLRSALA